jgi:CRP-like cAMP-binding protein
MYVIHSGSVQLTRRVMGREVKLATLPVGEFFGEMSIINNRPRSATATTLEDADLLVIDPRTFEAMIRGSSEIALRLIKKLAARLAAVNAQVEVLLLKDINHRVVLHLRTLAETVGVPDGPGVRVEISVDELAAQVNLPAAEVAACIDRLDKARFVAKDVGSIQIGELGKLDQFLEFLELKEQYGE